MASLSVRCFASKRVMTHVATPRKIQIRNCDRIRSSRRFFATQQPFSSFEYPLRTEAPTVTRTTAEEAAEQGGEEKTLRPPSPTSADAIAKQGDPFGDLHMLSQVEREAQRKAQKQYLSTQVMGSQPISVVRPDFIPPNVSENLEVPKTEITTLSNGVRVVSQEMYGQVCTVGILSDVGSRHEEITGTCHLMELLAFHSTLGYSSALQILQQLQDWGGTNFANTGREQTLYCLDILRPNVEQGMELLKQVTLEPQFHPEEVEECKQAMTYQAMEVVPELMLGEMLQEAAYGSDQQLGKPHFCPLNDISGLSAQTVRDFHETHMMQNPKGLVVAGAGIGHDQLVDMAAYHYGHLVQEKGSETRTIDSIYRGGSQHHQTQNSIDGFTRVCLAFEVGGWHSNDLVSACVLQTLLGGGNSFSAGGPGKGMYSRLYRQVLNRYHWAESAEAFTAFHDESGLFGISGSSPPAKSRDVARVQAEHFAGLAQELVSDEEFDRARNMLKCNVLSQLESRLVLFEDMGRQVLTYGQREDIEAMRQKIDAVTREELRDLIRRALTKPPSVATVGDDLSNVPSHEDVASWFS